MNKLAVVYWSGTGNTGEMANAIAEGINATDKEADVLTCDDFSSVDDYAGFAFGCPSMGSEVLEEGEFQPMWDNVKETLAGKDVVLFGSYGWGDGEWMRTWETECKDLGINVIESYICNESPDSSVLEYCNSLGRTLASK